MISIKVQGHNWFSSRNWGGYFHDFLFKFFLRIFHVSLPPPHLSLSFTTTPPSLIHHHTLCSFYRSSRRERDLQMVDSGRPKRICRGERSDLKMRTGGCRQVCREGWSRGRRLEGVCERVAEAMAEEMVVCRGGGGMVVAMWGRESLICRKWI